MFIYVFYLFWNISPFFISFLNPFDFLASNLLEPACRSLHGFHYAFSDLFKSFWPCRFKEIFLYFKNSWLEEFKTKLPLSFLIVMGRTLDFF
jgi:hypothetical protein